MRGLVSANGYNIQNIAASVEPRLPAQEHRAWYQFYFHTERGRAGLTKYRHELGKLLWQLWSPNWKFDDATYERTAKSFDNPDFVDIVIHSYRHRYGYAPGDPDLETIEQRLAATPAIPVPTIALYGGGDGVSGRPNPQTAGAVLLRPHYASGHSRDRARHSAGGSGGGGRSCFDLVSAHRRPSRRLMMAPTSAVRARVGY